MTCGDKTSAMLCAVWYGTDAFKFSILNSQFSILNSKCNLQRCRPLLPFLAEKNFFHSPALGNPEFSCNFAPVNPKPFFFRTMELQSKVFILGEDTAWETPDAGVRRQVMGYDEPLMLVKVEFQTGAVGAVHAHPHRQASYVASGKFEVQVGGEKKTLGAGDGFFVAPDVPHGVLCLESGVLVDTFNPMRRDFLGR